MKTNSVNRTSRRRSSHEKRRLFLGGRPAAEQRRFHRRLHMESLEDRRVLAYTATLVGGVVTLTGDGAVDSLTLDVAGGLLRHNRFTAGDPGFISDNDFISGNATDDTIAAAAVTSLTATDAGANDTVVLAQTPLGAASALNLGGAGALLTVSGYTSITDNGNLSVASLANFTAVGAGTITLGDGGGEITSFGSLKFSSPGPVNISTDASLDLNGASSANALVLSAAGALTDSGGGGLAVTTSASLTATAITLGEAAEVLNFGSLTFNSAGAVNITESSATDLTGASTANTLILTSSGTITDDAAADLTVVGIASFTGTAITLGDQVANDVNLGLLTFNSTGAVAITEDSSTNLTGASTANSLTLISAGGIFDSPPVSVTVTNDATLTAAGNILLDDTTISVGGNASFSGALISVLSAGGVNFGSLTFNSAGAVLIQENSATSITGVNTALSLILFSVGAITDAAGVSLTVTNNASFNGTSILLGDQPPDVVNFGFLTFNSAGAVNIAEDSDTLISGANTANSLVLTSAGAITDAVDTDIAVTNNASFNGTSILIGDNALDVQNYGSLTFTSTGTVNITEDSSTALAITSTGTTIVLTSAGAITDAEGDPANEITGTALSLIASGGIGTLAARIHVNVTNLDLANATSGGIFVTDTGGGVTLTNLTGPNAVDNGAGAAAVTGGGSFVQAASPLTIAANAITNSGAGNTMTYTADDSAAAGDNLTVNSGVTVQETTGALLLNVGDNLLVDTTSTVRAAQSLTINLDTHSPAADVGVGSIASIFGTIRNDTAGITITGNADGDTITIDNNGAALGGTLDGVVVSAGQLFTINGGGGSDTLTLEDGSDLTGDTYTITATTISTGGGNLFNNAPGLNYSNLETINIQNSNGPTNADGDVVTVTSLNAGTTYNVDGNNPTGLPGDILRLNPPGSINVYEIGGNYVFEFPGSGNLVATEFETIDLRPGNGILNIIGDEGQGQAGGASGGLGTDERDKITVVGTGVGAGTLQLSHLAVPIAIPPSVTFSGVTRLNVDTFDLADGLAITPYANNTPQGWGIETYYNEGPPVLDGDLLIYNGVLGVSENIVIQPSAPQAGQLFANNAATGTPIAVINYILNVNIIVNGSSPAGTVGDTDSLTLRGTDPANPGTSGQDTFVADFSNTGAVGDEKVVVTDTVGGANLYSLQNFSNFSTINIESLAGADIIGVTPVSGLTVNVDGGLPAAGAPGVASDTLGVIVPFNATITQGANSTTGQITSTAGPVNFSAVEVVALVSGDLGALTVNATDDNDTIAAADIGGADLVWVNDGPVIAFLNFSSLTLNGRFGDDSFSISPSGLAVTAINVNGGDPTASDTVIVNGTAAQETITVDQFTTDGARVTGLGPTVNVTTAEALTINGLGGVDNLRVITPAGLQLIALEDDGPSADSGAIRMRNSGVLREALLPVNFLGLGADGVTTGLTFEDIGGTRVDELTITPRAEGNGSDQFIVTAAGGILLAQTSASLPNQQLPVVATPGVTDLNLLGLAGDDVFFIPGNHPFAEILVDGGDPSASDVLNFTGTGPAVTANLALQTVGQAGSGAIGYSGVEIINISAGGGTLAVIGTGQDEDLTVTVLSATSGKIERGAAVQKAGEVQGPIAPPLVNYSNITGPLSVDLAGGTDTLIVVGNALSQTFNVNATGAGFVFPAPYGLVPANTIQVDDGNNGSIDGTIVYSNNESVEVFGLEGNDTFNVAAGLVPVFVDGGDPIGTTAGDRIVPFNATDFEAGPESDEGGFVGAGFARISFDHIEAIGPIVGSPCVLILGTNGDDDITVIARDASYVFPNPVPPGLDGIRDFTVSVNGGPEILYIDVTGLVPGIGDLFIDGLAGDDDIVIRTPAPNQALWSMNVRVAGGPPSDGAGNEGDRLVLETPGTDTTIYTPTGSDTGRVLIDENANDTFEAGDTQILIGPFLNACPSSPTANDGYNSSPGGIELFEYDGETGADSLQIFGDGRGVSLDRFVHTPGDARDAGKVDVINETAGVTLLAIHYQNLGLAGNVEVYGGGNQADLDTLVALGTGASDSLDAEFSAINEIRINLRSDLGSHIPLLSENVENYILDTLEGDDLVTLQAPLSATGFFRVFGGGPSGSDFLALFGAAAAVESVTISPDNTNPLDQDVIGLGAPIDVSGIELIRYTGALSAAGARDDTLTVAPGTADTPVRVAGGSASNDVITSNVLPDIEFNGLNTFLLDVVGGINVATFATFSLRGALPGNYQVQGGQADTLVIEGIDGTVFLANDSFTVTNPAGGAAPSVAITDANAVIGPVTVTSITNGIGRLQINTLGGDDVVTVNVGSTDLIGIPFLLPIAYDGGGGSDRLVVTGTPATAVDEVIYSPGPAVTEGRLAYENAANTQLMTIDFLNLEPIVDLVPAATLTVNGTNANNAINYTQGTVAANGLVSVDAFETIEFSNKSNIVINALAGNDTINLNNASTPTGLATIRVNGGDPTASDTVVVNGTAAADTIVFTPSAADAGTVLVNALPIIGLATVEHLTINGLGGNDTLNTVTPAAASSEIEITPGAAPDSGNLRVDSLIPLSFTNLGAAGRLLVTDAGVDRDRVIYNGTAADDVFRVPDSGGIPAPSLELTSHLGVGTTGIEAYVLRGLSGDDRFEVVAQANITVDVQGGDPGGSDVLEFTSVGATTVNLGSSSIDDAGVAGTPDVVYAGVETINIISTADALSIAGSAGDDDLTVTVLSATSGKVQIGLAVQQNGQVGQGLSDPLINYSGIVGALTVDMLTGEDTLVVVGNAFAQTFDIDAAAGTVAIDDAPNGVGNDGLVNFTNTESLAVFGLEGNDTFNITAGPNVPVFLDGGDPIGQTAGDSINFVGGGGLVTFESGPENDEGGIIVGVNARVSFDHIEDIVVTNGGCALILGTNGDDDITVIARTELANPTQFVGADGIQDFTTSVNAGPDILWLDTPELYIDALSGDDDIVIRTPAPNNAEWDVDVFVAGGPPSDGADNEGDRLVVETPFTQPVIYTPTGSDTGTINIDTNNGGVFDTLITIGPFLLDCEPDEIIDYRSSDGGVELLEYDGEGADDVLTVVGTADTDFIIHTPGAGRDEGSIRVNELLAINYQNLGLTGSVTVDADGGDGDHLVVYGTLGRDQLLLVPTTGAVSLSTPSSPSGSHLDVQQISVEILTLEGLEGDDQFFIIGPQPYELIIVHGGGPGGSDTLTFQGAALVDELFEVHPDRTKGTGIVQVNALVHVYDGIEQVILEANPADADTLLIHDDGGDNVWTVDKGPGVGALALDRVQIDSREPFDYAGFDGVTLQNDFGTDLFRVFPSNLIGFSTSLTVLGDATLPADDVLELIGTPGNDVVTGASATVTTNGVSVRMGDADFAELRVLTLDGDDNINLDLDLPGLNAVRKLVDGGAGNDIIDLAGTVDATIFGGTGDDNIVGSPAADLIYGDDGNDTINAGAGNDVVYAGRGNDIVIGGADVDILYGEDGNDRFGDLATGNGVADDAGNDQFFGGDGSDIFVWDPGDGSDLIEGGANESDLLIFNGSAGAEIFTFNAVGTRLELLRSVGAIDMDVAGVEQVNLNAGGGADIMTVNDLFPTDVRVINLDYGAADGAADTATINGRNVSDNVNVTATATVVAVTGLRYDVNITSAVAANLDAFVFNGNNGNDTITSPLSAADSALLGVFFSPTNFTLNGNLGDDYVSGYGNLHGNDGVDVGGVDGNDSLVGGALANVIRGGGGNDQIFGGAGADLLFGDDGEDTFVPGFDSAGDTVNGGAGFDTILVQATSGNDRIDVEQDSPTQVRYEVSGIAGDGVLGGAGTETDTLIIATVEELKVVAGSGDDTIRVAHDDLLVVAPGVAANVLRFTVDGGAPGASDRLTVTDQGPGDTTVQRIGGTPGDGSFTMYAFVGGAPAAGIIGLPPVVYTGVEFASLNPLLPITGGTGADGNGRLFVFKHDPYEQNNSLPNATFLGVNETTNLDPTIDPGADPIGGPGFGLPGDEDWYRIVAEHNGTLDIQVYFDQQGTLLNGRAGLPGEGNLEIALYDVDGLIGAAPLPGEIAGTGAFGTNDSTDNERIRIPAVAGQTYYLRVLGAPFVGNVENASPAINVYNVAVVNMPAAVPFDLELDDTIFEGSVVAFGGTTTTVFRGDLSLPAVNDFFNGKVVSFKFGTTTVGLRGEEAVVLDYDGPTRQFTLAFPLSQPPVAGDTFQIESVDTGRSNNDNITRDNTPTIFLRVPDVINVAGVATLDDLPYNGSAPGDPPDQFIGIPFVSSVLLDVPATAAGFRVPIFVTERGTSDLGPPNNVLAGYAQPVDPVNRPGLFSFTFGSTGSFIPSLTPDGSYFISSRLEMIDPAQNIIGADNQEQAQGYGAFAQSLEIFVDTTEPPVSFGDPGIVGDGLTADSDSFVIPNPETIIDLVTNDLTPTFWGRAEADATIRLFADSFIDINGNGEFDFIDNNGNGVFDGGDVAIDTPPNGMFDPNTDVFIGQDTAIPLDGNQQEPNGFWKIESVINFNDPRFFIGIGGTRTVFVTAEDVAGNVNDNVTPEELDIFIDVTGPQIIDVTVNAPSGSIDDVYNLFDPKPSTDGPTPLVNSIFIEIQDFPIRDLVPPGIFDSPAFKPDIAENPGHYLVTGDYNGIFPILDVVVFLDPVVDGQPATGRVQLVFRREGPDGVFNTSDDIGAPLFDDRYTLFVDDDGIIDFAGNKLDGESNADEPHDSPPGPGEPDVLGVDGVPTGDGIPGGDFIARFTVDSRPELGVWAAGSAFLDINGNTIWDPDNEDFTNRDITHVMGYVSDDLFAGRFATDDGEGGLFDDGFDKLGAYGRVGTSSFRWLIDTDNDGVADIEVLDPANVNGKPVAGNFAVGIPGDEVGLFTGTTWFFDTNHDYHVDTSLPWAVAGSAIVGDFDGDGLDDLATWSNDVFSFDLSSINSAGGGLPGNPGIDGTIEKQFRFGFPGPGERPVAADMNQDGIEDVGLWMPARDGITPRGQAEWYFLISGVTQNDTTPNVPTNLGPTIPGSNDPTPGSYLALPNAFYGLTNYTTGRIVVDPLFPGTNIVRFQPVPFGNDQYMQFGDEFALPLVGNFDPPHASTPPIDTSLASNPRNQYDVNNDGRINTLDLLALINWLTTSGIGPAPSTGFVSAPFVDVNSDFMINTMDLLAELNYLIQNPPVSSFAAAESAAEGEGGSADDYFTHLGSGGGAAGDDDDLFDLLARG